MATPDKLKITAYNSIGATNKLSTNPSDSYMALVNPEKYAIQYQINLNARKVPGNAGSDPSYIDTSPPTLQFDFLFDSTGVIPQPSTLGVIGDIPIVGSLANAASNIASPKEQYDVMKEISKFNSVVFLYKGTQHSPRKVQILWGQLIFDGNLTTLNFDFKLFKPDGTPLRAVATAAFLGTITDKLRVAAQGDQSPDLTHVRRVQNGDTLPLMTYRIYGDASFYLEVARVNNLTNFRNLKAGDSLKFPPISK